MRSSQPLPYGSSFTVSGAPTTCWFTSSTSPETGPDLEHGRMRAGRHLAAAVDRHPLPGNRLLLHHEGDEPALGAVGLDAAEDVDTLELLLERARPPEAGGDRVGVRPDVVAVQGVADLEAQRVAGAEPARDDAALEHCVPEPDGVLAHAEQLAAVLARVARAVHHHLDAVDRALGERERGGWRQPELLDRPR